MYVSQIDYQTKGINNNQNKYNQGVNFKAGKIRINKEDIPFHIAKNIKNNLRGNSTYKEFTQIFDADFNIFTRISVMGDFLAEVDINYKKIDPNKNKLQRLVQKIIEKLTKKSSEPMHSCRFGFSDWSCPLAAENLSKSLADNNCKLYEMMQKIINATPKN